MLTAVRSAAPALAIAFAAMLATGPAPAQAPLVPERPASFADLAERLSPAVVNISTRQSVGQPGGVRPPVPPGGPLEDLFRDFFERNQRGPRSVNSLGSGFVIDPAGFIVTNNHVIENADEIVANFPDGSSLPATLVGRDPKTDLAVLKVEPTTPLPAVGFGDSDVLRVGDWVLAIGNPFGLGGSVSAGIVSALQRDINAGPYDEFIQTDAAINRGNSGGPLFNMAGEVVGVNTAIISPSGGSIGIGFSVPSRIAVSVVEQLREFGETRRGWLGVRIQTVTPELADSLELPEASGALVADVTADGPAAAGGVEAGDVILSFNGRKIGEMRDLPRIVAETAVGSRAEVEVWRKGERRRLNVELGRLEESEPITAALGTGSEPVPSGTALGMTMEALTAAKRAELGLGDDVEGVLITEVEPGSPAETKAVLAGEVIREVSQSPVRTPQEVVEAIEAARAEKRATVLLLISNGGELRFVALSLAPN